MGQLVKFGRTSQIGISRIDAKEGWQQKLNEQRSLEMYSKIQKGSACSEPEEIANYQQTARLPSSCHSLSSSEIFHLLSVNSISACSENGTLDTSNDGKGNEKLNLNDEIKRSMDEITALLSTGNVHCTRCQKYKTRHKNCKSLRPVAEWLKTKLMNIVPRGYGRKREDIRFQTAQMQAALSVARLATAVTGIIGNIPFESNLSGITMTDRRQTDTKMRGAITSAAALVATSCAEAAMFAGASIEQVSSVINMGLETTAMGDLLTLTTSAAACLRGAEGLKTRTISNCASEGHMNSQKDGVLLVRIPDGRLHNRMVSVHRKYEHIMLTLGKKHRFATSEKYVIFHEQGKEEEFSYPMNEHSYRAISLSTSGGTIQLLFEEHEQYRSWKKFIRYLTIKRGGTNHTES